MIRNLNDLFDRVFRLRVFFFDFNDTKGFPLFEILKNESLLILDGNVNKIECQQCYERDYELIEYDDGKPFYRCSQGIGTRKFLKEEEIQRWKFDLEKLLAFLSEKLGIVSARGNPVFLSEKDIWLLGKKESASIFFSLEDKPTDGFLIIPFLEQEEEKNIAIESIVGISKKRIAIDKKAFERKCKQEKLSFNEETGEIRAEGEPIGSLKINSPQYLFFLCLWKKKGKWANHEDIFRFVKEKDGRNRKATPQEFCNTQKSTLIKQIPELKNFLDSQNLKTGVNQCILRI